MKYVVTSTCDGIEYADKEFMTYASALEYADKLIKRYKTQYKPEQYSVCIVNTKTAEVLN